MQPTIIEDVISVAAGAVNENVIVSNSSLRGLLNAPYPSRMRLLAVISAAGLRIDAVHGSQKYVDSSEPRVNTFAEDPYDLINGEAYCQAQEQLVIRANNTTGAAISLGYRLILEPLVDEEWNGEAIELPPDTVVTQRVTSVAAAAVDVQLMDGLAFQQVAEPGILRALMTAAATGVTRQLFIDQDRISPASLVSIANRVPQDPLDTTIDGVEVPPNAQQFLSVSNSTVAAIIVRWKIKLRKLVRT